MAPRSSRCTFTTPLIGLPLADELYTPTSFLDPKDQTSLEYKLDSFSSVYRRLTGKEVCALFPSLRCLYSGSRSWLNSGSLRVPHRHLRVNGGRLRKLCWR